MRKITQRGVTSRNQLSINAVATASSTEPFTRTEAEKEQLMRTLKIGLVITFFLAALAPAISTRVAALTATPAQSRSSKDRKSTRLNSSHLGISYAVFCLKKK